MCTYWLCSLVHQDCSASHACVVWVPGSGPLLLQVELEIMLPEEMSVKESHDIALMLQHKVPLCMPILVMSHLITFNPAWPSFNP